MRKKLRMITHKICSVFLATSMIVPSMLGMASTVYANNEEFVKLEASKDELKEGESTTVVAKTSLPETAEVVSYEWTSSKEDVASVTSNEGEATVKALTSGSTKITVVVNYEVKNYLSVTDENGEELEPQEVSTPATTTADVEITVVDNAIETTEELQPQTTEGENPTENAEGENTDVEETPETETTPEGEIDTAGLTYDATSEEYIRSHINTNYANATKMELKNGLLVKQTLLDGSLAAENETMDSLLVREDAAEVFYTFITGNVAMYDVDDNSDYYVAYANTMQNDENARVTSASFAHFDSNGEVIEGAYYDASTGLAYIPKSATIRDGKLEVMGIQIQLLQAVSLEGTSIDKVKSNVDYSTVDEGDEVEVGSGDVTTLNLETKVKTDTGLSREDMVVSVNGIPTNEYTYSPKTGTVTVAKSSAVVNSISVVTNDEVVQNTRTADVPSTFAVTTTAQVPSIGEIDLPAGMTTGSTIRTNATVLYVENFDASYPGHIPAYGLSGDEGRGGVTLTNTIYNGSSDITIAPQAAGYADRCMGIDLASLGWNYRSTYGSTLLNLRCCHITNPLGSTNHNSGTNSIFVRVLKDSDGEIILGFLTPEIYTQAGAGFAKFTEQKGEAYLEKVSANPELTNGNPCYSLAGAVYGIYNGGTEVARMTTDANGHAVLGNIDAGNYTLKEISAPQGYQLDGNSYPFTITGGQRATIRVSDVPGNDPLVISISKLDKDGNPGAAGAASLEGAEFTVNYYAGFYDETNLPDTPTRSWVIQTIKSAGGNYLAQLDEAHKVSGDAFYTVNGNRITLPLGTLSVEETKAPNGYLLEGATFTTADGDEISLTGGDKYVSQITQEGGSLGSLRGGNQYIMGEPVTRGDFDFVKQDAELGTPMEGIEFELTSDTTGESHIIVTDENGYFSSASSYTPHSQNTNNGTVESGLWFGSDTPNDEEGALPFDTYTLKELRGPNNAIKDLVTIKFSVTRENFTIHLGTILNNDVTLKTVARDSDNNSHYTQALSEVNITDTLTYTGLHRDETYKAVGTLINKANGLPVTDPQGNVVTVTKEFTAPAIRGTLDMEFSFDATQLAGTDVVVFEQIINANNEVVVAHEDLNDEDQTIYFAAVTTQARDSESRINIAQADGTVRLIDTVSYTNLRTDRTFDVIGTLMDKETGRAILDADGHEITAQTTVRPEGKNGTVDVTFEFDGSNLEGKTVVVFEEVSYRGNVYATHQDINDAGQTIHFPKVRTSALDSDTVSQMANGDNSVTIIDSVTYENLVPGREYTLNGTMMDKETGKAVVDGAGRTVTATSRFTPVAADGQVNISFTFNATNLHNKTLVVFEDLNLGNVTVATHSDIEDVAQTIYIPEVKTTALDKDTEIQASYADNEVTIIDTVEYSNVIAGNSYTIKGTLMDKDTGAALSINGQTITSEVTFIAEETSGSVELAFTFNGSALAGKTVVAFEDLLYNGKLVGTHADINDTDQTIYFPAVSTVALDSDTNDHLSKADSSVTITDTVSYKNVVVGKEYTVKGKLVNKATGETVKDAKGKELTDETTFTADKANGEIKVTFKFDASNLANQTLVAFEELYYGDHLIANHTDINDANQTIHLPLIRTTALDSDTGDHIANADGSITINDTVSYQNVIPGKEYTVKGKLMDQKTGKAIKDAKGNEITKDVKFTPTAANGEVLVAFTFDGSNLANQTLVAFEELYLGSAMIAEHSNINDGGQTIYIPEVKTTALDKITEDHLSYAGKEVTIIDTVEYSNVIVGKEYVIKGTLMDKDTGKALTVNGNAVTSTVSFVATRASGSIELPFTFDGSALAGKTVVAFEDLLYNNKLVGSHTDINDTKQTVHLPAVSTIALDSETNDHISKADNSITVTDTLSYRNVIAGKEYTVKGKLMNKDTGAALLDAKGKEITDEVTFTADKANGEVKVTFKFDGSKSADQTMVVFEELYFDGHLIADHKNINDENQTVYMPLVTTQALDSETNDHIANADNSITITDTVSYKNVLPGKEYTIKGKLMDQKTGKAIKDAKGKEITKEVTFTAANADGQEKITFTFDGSNLANQTLVAFEELYYKGVMVGEHSDINDGEQTVHIPEVKTTALDKITEVQLSYADKEVNVVDTVEYSNVIPGKQYTIQGTLMDKETNKPLVVDGHQVTSSATFTAAQASGKVDITFTFNGSALAGKTVVAFEELLYNNKLVGFHTDINDVKQTDYLPAVSTVALDSETNDHISKADNSITVTDTVSYRNVIAGQEYTIKGKLMNKDTGKVVLDASGKEVTKEVKFTAKEVNGEIKVTFKFDGSNLANQTLVAFEELYYEEHIIGNHSDINDANQTICVPLVTTQALDSDTNDHIANADNSITITDTVSYKNVLPGKEYTIKGKLMDQRTGKAIKDAKGKEITKEVTFTADKANGEVKVTFKFDGSNLANQTLVAFEELYYKGVMVGEHSNINDGEQTIYIPEVKTTALDKITEDHLSYAGKEVTIIDTVEYSNVIVGKEYVIKGTLMDKDTGKALTINGNAVTSTVSFVATKASGSIELPFTFDGSALAGKTVVAFEDLLYNNKLVGSHTDINDTKQTVHLPAVSTIALDSETSDHIASADGNVIITDTVSYRNVIAGQEYTIKGKLMDKNTGKAIKDAKGNEIAKDVKFTADKANGEVKVTFKFDGSNLANQTLVAFEELYYEEHIIGNHSDINDANQTVVFPDVQTEAIVPSNETQNAMAKDSITIKDTVTYSNVMPGKEYTVKGTLMDKDTGKALQVNGKPVTAESTFTAQNANGTVIIEFTFDATGLEGKTLVAFEDLLYKDVVVGTHSDINDVKQTTYIPKITTTALDTETVDQNAMADESVTIIDKVEYTNLIPGKTYTLDGVIMDKETGEPLQTPATVSKARALGDEAEGEETPDDNETPDTEGETPEEPEEVVVMTDVRNSITFTPTEANGSIEMNFVFNANELAGKSVVVFESLSIHGTHEGADVIEEVATHSDVDSVSQTIYFPDVKTTALDSESKTQMANGDEEVTIVDTVEYTNLIPGKEYRVEGTLINKNTGEFLFDEEGEYISGDTLFTPVEADGYVEVTFTFDGSILDGETIVVFEDLYFNDVLIGTHADVNDVDQTIYFPDLHTTAIDGESESKTVNPDEDVTIIDTVEYSNLIVGNEYTVKGSLTDKETGLVVLDDEGNEVTAETTFTPEESTGEVEVTFTFSGVSLEGKTLVVFEDLFLEDNLLATHADLEDVDQTVYFPELHTTATDAADGDKEITSTGTVSINDKVEYRNLVVGEEYTVKGTLMDKATGNALLVNGQEVTSQTTFIPEETSGTVDVVFTFDASGLGDRVTVAFETLETNDVTVGHHTDIDDEGQTVKLVAPIEVVKTGDDNTMLLLAGAMGIILLAVGAGAITFSRKKRKEVTE